VTRDEFFGVLRPALLHTHNVTDGSRTVGIFVVAAADPGNGYWYQMESDGELYNFDDFNEAVQFFQQTGLRLQRVPTPHDAGDCTRECASEPLGFTRRKRVEEAL
jgi:hypothetical protein